MGSHNSNELFEYDVEDRARGRVFLSEALPHGGTGSTMRAIKTNTAHNGHLRDAVFSPDGERLYSVGSETGKPKTSELRVWDVTRVIPADCQKTPEHYEPLVPAKVIQHQLFTLDLSPDGATLLTCADRFLPPKGERRGVLTLWEVDIRHAR